MTDAKKFALYFRPSGARSKRWVLHDTYPTWDEAMTAAFRLDATSTWVTAIEAASTADTEMTPAEAKTRRPAVQPA